MNWLLALGLASLLPIWRVPGRDPYTGYNVWDCIDAHRTEVEHISAQEAIEEARAYFEQEGLAEAGD